MPDTPKSFEEEYGDYNLAQPSALKYVPSVTLPNALPPQTAPDLDLLEGLATRREGDEGYLLPIRYRQPLLCLIAAARQAAAPGVPEGAVLVDYKIPWQARYQRVTGHNTIPATVMKEHEAIAPAQTAVGEGELLKRPRTRHVTGLMAHIEALQAQLREAIAQRDEESARHTKWVAKQAVHLFEIGLRSTETLGVWRNERADAAEAKLAALDVSKPEERLFAELVEALEHPMQRHSLSIRVKRILKLLRSLPSEPQSENRKAAENG